MIAATLTCWCQSNHNGDLQDWKNYIKKFYEPTLKWMRDPTGKDVLGTYPQVCNNARYRASTNNTGSASNTTPSNSPCATPPIAYLFARRTSRTNTTCRRSSSSRHTRCATCCACTCTSAQPWQHPALLRPVSMVQVHVDASYKGVSPKAVLEYNEHVRRPPHY